MKDGYYWVRDHYGLTSVAEHKDGAFWLPGCEHPFTQSELVEIGDYIETPDKYKE